MVEPRQTGTHSPQNCADLIDGAPSRAMPNHRLAVLIDGAHLFYAAAQMGIEVDYVKLLAALSACRRLLRACFYTGVDPQNDRQRGFLSWLTRNGYRVISKPLTQGDDGSRRANLQVEIAVDMLRYADHCDALILLAGDGALAHPAERLGQLGTRIEVIGLLSMTSEELIRQADCYTDLAELSPAIQKSLKERKRR